MSTLALFLVAFLLLGLGGVLKKGTSPYSRVGGDEYNRRKKRKLVAEILLIAGGLVLLTAILSAFVPRET